MKITEIKKTKTNIKFEHSDDNSTYITEFSKTITLAEKEKQLYLDWDTYRIGECIQAFIKQYIAWCPSDITLDINISTPLAHYIVNSIGHGSININFRFDGTKPNIKDELFEFKLCAADNTNKTPPIINDTTLNNIFIKTEEGEAIDSPKYTSFYTQTLAIGQIYTELRPYITKQNQLDFISLVACLVIEAEYMSKLNASNFELNVEGLSSESKDPTKILFLQNTQIQIVGHKKETCFANYIYNESLSIN